MLLHHYMGEIDGAFRSWGLSRGGTGAISEAIAGAAREAGVEIRTETPVSRILVKDGAAVGVVLENGDYYTANVVASSLDPRQTFTKLVGEDNLPPEFVEDVNRYKYRGSSGKVNLALDALPDFTCLPGAGHHLRGAVSISPGVDYMERAYDEAKYGRYSRQPYIDMVIPTLTDPSVAPPGKHVMSCFVQYAPYHLKEEGGWDAHREAFGDTVINTIAKYAPNIKDIILHRQVLTPLDIERDFGLSEGNIFQGELTLEQLFFLRPAPGWAQYKTPVQGLYMCGSATHPGGGIMGAPGRNAAHAHPQRDEQEVAMADTIIIGGGHNALVAAFYLAKAGRRPIVLERRAVVGGCATSEEFAPGYRCATLAHTLGPLRPSIVRDMQLERRGVKFVHPDPRLVSVGLDGRALVVLDRSGPDGRRDPAVFRERRGALPGVLRHARPPRRVPVGSARDDAAVDRRAVHR